MIMELKDKGLKCRLGMHSDKAITFVLLFVVSMTLSSCGGSVKAVPAGAGAVKKDFVAEARAAIVSADRFMGDWQGSWKLNDGTDSGPLVAQVISLGKGEYRAKVLDVFDRQTETIAILDGKLEGEAVRLAGQANYRDGTFDVKAAIEDGKFTGSFMGQGEGSFALERVFRVSRTMGAKPPKGAIVLFNGKDFKEWKRARVKEGEDDTVKWKLVNGAMVVTRGGGGNIITRKTFNDVKLHIEFRSSFMPDKRGQSRGNSGVYLQGRYECQVLDSYGLEGKDNECGGIYKVRAPSVNMCAPPTQWQTYDITFTAPKFDAEGKLTEMAKMTVVHNGVLIQYKTEVGGSTTASAGGKASEPGGVYLQDHGNPVEYRNIWLVEL